ncbi:MAG TPA: hypothetical protein P5243_07560, partial [Bacteroidales bacterium]|nr:hypothetical protein [Bacteroidales bacterium]
QFVKTCTTCVSHTCEAHTSGIKHWGLSGYSSVLPRIKVRCRGILSQLRNPQRFHTADRQTV